MAFFSPVLAAAPAPGSASPAAQPAAREGAAAKAFDAAGPSTWCLSAKLGKGSAARAALVRELCARPTTPTEVALTPAEAEALLDDPRAERIYADKTISIVAPSMLKRQRAQHVDLLKIFLQPERVEAGARFAKEQQALLEKAEQKHRVDREVIVSILMWESKLGTITGDFAAFNSFVSQAFFAEEANAVALSRPEEKKAADPAKQAQRVATIQERARRNLLVLVRQCRARGMDPLEVKGSWAGALGFPQFMPASLRWAEDGDGDGKIDLYTFPDSIASIGRYLAEHGFAKSPERAVWGYNHEDAYVKGVLAYAKALEQQLAQAPTPAGGTGPTAAPSAP